MGALDGGCFEGFAVGIMARVSASNHDREQDQRISELEGHAQADQAAILSLEAQAEVDHALIAHLEAEGEIDRAKIANLEVALISARRIGAAMGVLMASRKVTDLSAFDLLRMASQTTHRKLRDVADDVLITGMLPKM